MHSNTHVVHWFKATFVNASVTVILDQRKLTSLRRRVTNSTLVVASLWLHFSHALTITLPAESKGDLSNSVKMSIVGEFSWRYRLRHV